MKTISFLKIALFGPALLWMTGCTKHSTNMWEDQPQKKTQKNYSSSLWESDDESQDQESVSLAAEEFIPLNEDDLKNQFTEEALSASLGENGIPSAHEFADPQGDLAAIFKPVFFGTDEHTLKNKDYVDAVHRMASYLTAHPNVAIIVEGHCDERGPQAYNMALGAKRANYIRSLLVKEGVNAHQVHTISCGKEMPFKEGHDPESWSQNRRGHFRIYKK